MHRLADLHTHSHFSDGTSSPESVVKHAVRRRVEMFALTDHDTVGGVAESARAAAEAGLPFITGVEISTSLHDHLHILGYGIEPNHPGLAAFLEFCRESRKTRVRQITGKLAAAGADITYEEVAATAHESISRPHVADLLVKKGLASTRQLAFRQYLVPGKPGYAPSLGPGIAETIAQITAAGGKAVLAHPGIVQSFWDFPAWTTAGLAGIEVYYPLHTASMSGKLEKIAEKYGLFMTGGSDYHGPASGREKTAGIRVPEKTFNKLRELFF
ncbi:MAG: PHP domain-containing protein [Elusimicrobiaceae bacterium]|nr:PHP domain-containing protein [Elusimicrobiaceae bacterium]